MVDGLGLWAIGEVVGVLLGIAVGAADNRKPVTPATVQPMTEDEVAIGETIRRADGQRWTVSYCQQRNVYVAADCAKLVAADQTAFARWLDPSFRLPSEQATPTPAVVAPSRPLAAAPRDAAERLRTLDDLRAKGLITSSEYDARRKAILDGL